MQVLEQCGCKEQGMQGVWVSATPGLPGGRRPAPAAAALGMQAARR